MARAIAINQARAALAATSPSQSAPIDFASEAEAAGMNKISAVFADANFKARMGGKKYEQVVESYAKTAREILSPLWKQQPLPDDLEVIGPRSGSQDTPHVADMLPVRRFPLQTTAGALATAIAEVEALRGSISEEDFNVALVGKEGAQWESGRAPGYSVLKVVARQDSDELVIGLTVDTNAARQWGFGLDYDDTELTARLTRLASKTLDQLRGELAQGVPPFVAADSYYRSGARCIRSPSEEPHHPRTSVRAENQRPRATVPPVVGIPARAPGPSLPASAQPAPQSAVDFRRLR